MELFTNMKTAINYVTNPVLMNGVIKKTDTQKIEINLNGRLGLLTLDNRLVMNNENLHEGDAVTFYFSYIQTPEFPMNYDYQDLVLQEDIRPSYIDGKIVHVDDVAVRVSMSQDLGMIYVPRRWVIANAPLESGMAVEFFISKIQLK